MLSVLIALVFAAPVQLALQPGSRLWIEGDSNVRRWTCQAAIVNVDAQARTAEGGAPPAVERLHAAVPVKELRCGDGHMEDKLRDALKEPSYPRIEFAFSAVEALPGDAPGEYRLKTTGLLSIAGATRPVTMVVKAGAHAGGVLFARGSLPLEMTRFGVEPPTAFLGLLKCKDRIVVRFDLLARASAGRSYAAAVR